MHYKIELNTKTAKWEVFLEKYIFFFKVQGKKFETYDEATQYAESTGLNKAYTQKNAKDYFSETQPAQPISQTGGIRKRKAA